MDQETMARCFNLWMKRYTEEPEKFAADFHTVGEFLQQQAGGQEPSYGTVCATMMAEFATELKG